MSQLSHKLAKDEIIAAIQNGVLDTLKKLITPENVNHIKDRNGHTLLCLATTSDKIDIIKWLVNDINCDINLHCNGHTALCTALSKGYFDLFFYFIENNADCKGRNQLNLLHEAAAKNRLDIAKILIEKGADPNQLNNISQTPLTISVLQNNTEMCKYLLDNGACANVADRKGNTILHLACTLGDFDLVDVIVDNYPDCDLKCKNQNEETPLDLLWTTAIKEAKAPFNLIDKFIKLGALFSMPWNLIFNCHNHIVLIKCMALLCKYRLTDLFLKDKILFTELIIKGYWSNSLIVSIKSAILDHKMQNADEQQELYKAIETIVLSGELNLNVSELISTFYMFEDIKELEVYNRLNKLYSSPFNLMNLCRIVIRKNLKMLNPEFIHDELKMPEQLKKFLLFESG
jgi:hypothetical protein